ncbi:MAG: hypothetical protein AAGJ08_08895 [Cyanobacteria bacterium P01_H01_bin.35]
MINIAIPVVIRYKILGLREQGTGNREEKRKKQLYLITYDIAASGNKPRQPDFFLDVCYENKDLFSKPGFFGLISPTKVEFSKIAVLVGGEITDSFLNIGTYSDRKNVTIAHNQIYLSLKLDEQLVSK